MPTSSSVRPAVLNRTIVGVLCLLLTAAAAPGVQAADITDDNVAQMVASAKTPEDHQALAAYFRAKAAKAGENAKKHESMLNAFSGKPPQDNVWRTHCGNLINSFRSQKVDYEAMAQEQTTIAKTLAGSH